MAPSAPASAGPNDAEPVGRDDVDLGASAELAGFMLRMSQLKLFESFFAHLGDEGVRPGEITILMAIGRNPGIRQGVLADALKIKWSNMAKIVRQLEDAGLLTRAVPPSDRRAVELFLTDKGRALSERLLPRLFASDRAAMANLSDSECRTLLALLHKLVGTGGAPGAGQC